MERSITRWTTFVAAAALLSVPATGFAQSSATSQPPSQPPTSQSPATAQPPTTAQPPATATAQADAEVAKRHLTAARDALSQMTQMPEAAQLTGDARTQVSELISNFNTLITTTVDWPAAYAKVEANLNSLIGPKGSPDEPPARATGTEGAVGTSGSASVHPDIRAKLVEFRNHLEKFEQAAGGRSSSRESSVAAPATPDMTGATPAQPPAQPGSSDPQSSSINRDEALQHIQAIESLLSGQPAASGTPGAAGTTGSATAGAGASGSPITLDSVKVQQLRSHLAELKRIVGQR